MRYRGRTVALALALVLVLVGCSGDGEGGEAAAGDDASADTPPPGVEVADVEAFGRSTGEGVTVLVHAVEVDGDVVAVEVSVANPTGDDWGVANEDDPVLLLDDRGGTYRSKGEELVARSASRTRFRIEFAGPLGDDVGELALRFNDDRARSREIDMEIRGIPVPAERRVELPDGEPGAVALEDVVAHHPNGTNVVLRAVTVRPDVVEVAFQAVNGGDRDVNLAHVWSFGPDAELLEPGGRVLRFLPPDGNRNLRVPSGQRLTGTLRFQGPLGGEVDRVTLRLNHRASSSSESTNRPTITFADVPVRR